MRLPIVTGARTLAYAKASPRNADYIPHMISEFDASLMSAFGTLETGELTPVFQSDFIHGLNTQNWVEIEQNSATVGTNEGRLVLNSGTSANGRAVARSRRPLKYRAGQGMMARFTPVFAPVAGNNQYFGVGSDTDGYFIGFNNGVFGIYHRNAFAAANTFVAQADFNVDTVDGLGESGFDWQPEDGNGTPVMIKWPFLGFGNIGFYVQNPQDSRWILFHVIQYANTTNELQLSNPNLYFWAENENTGNLVDKASYCGSVGVFLSGTRSFMSCPKWAFDNTKTVTNTEVAIFSLKNATTYNTVANRSLVRLQSISCGAASTATDKSITVRLRIGATLGGVPAYTPINGSTAINGDTITTGNSIASADVAGTSATGGSLIYNLSFVSTGNTVIDLTDFDLFVAPGEILTVSAVTSTATSTTIAVALNWADDI